MPGIHYIPAIGGDPQCNVECGEPRRQRLEARLPELRLPAPVNRSAAQ